MGRKREQEAIQENIFMEFIRSSQVDFPLKRFLILSIKVGLEAGKWRVWAN